MDNADITCLSEAHPEWGHLKMLRADSAIFGFNVGEYIACDPASLLPDAAEALAALEKWANGESVELISSAVPAASSGHSLLLEKWGAMLVDTSVEVVHPRLAAIDPAHARLSVREAEKTDSKAILAVVEKAFQHGRYHTDLRFPFALAQKRFMHWAACGLEGDDHHKIHVLGPPGEVWGVIYSVLNEATAALRLGAVAPEKQSEIAGLGLYAGTLLALHQAGAKRAVTRIQMANTPVMNLYAALGFQFHAPHKVYHWHAPHAPHLLDEAAVLNRIRHDES